MVEPTAEQALVAPDRTVALLMTDDEIRRMYRIAESLALSGVWKDIRKAEAAFAKMVIGRDLGMTPAQAMQGIHFVEGNIQMHYTTLGQFIRSRDGYDYRAGWIKEMPRLMITDVDSGEVRPSDVPPETVFAWHDEEDPLDGRDVVGAVIVFSVDGAQRGLSRYTVEDATAAGLIKPGLDKRAAWMTSRRNMLLARAMSNGVKWFVPEVMGGLPVYVDGEIGSGAKPSLTAGSTSDQADEGSGVELGPQVEKVLARAAEVGHRGLANHAAVELAVGNRAPGVVKDWVARAHAELDRVGNEKLTAAEKRSAEAAVEGVAVEVADVPTGPNAPVSPNPDQIVSAGEREAQVQLLRQRLRGLETTDQHGLSEEDAEQLREEVELVEDKLRALGAEA